MQKTHQLQLHMSWLLSVAALLFGLVIVWISLWRAASMHAVSTNENFTTRKFYVGKRIQSDHVLFPLFNAGQRVQLVFESPEEQIFSHLKMAEERQRDVDGFLATGEHEQAFNSLIRAQLHLIRAEELSAGLDNNHELRSRIWAETEQLQTYFQQVQDTFPEFFDSELSEMTATFEQMQSTVSASL